jgi:hypothetical protein
MDCSHHEALVGAIARNEKDTNSLWAAVNEVRADIKGLIGKIGILVGTITALNTIVILIVQYSMKS